MEKNELMSDVEVRVQAIEIQMTMVRESINSIIDAQKVMAAVLNQRALSEMRPQSKPNGH